jgi:hypothetical protein
MLRASGDAGSCSRATPSAQKSVSCVARQKARGPGSESGRGAWRAQIPACVHQTFGMSPRLTGFSPPSGCRQKTQSAQRDPIDSGAAATPSPHHCWPCVCGQCGDLCGAVRRLRRVATAQALIISLLVPEGAAGAVRWGPVGPSRICPSCRPAFVGAGLPIYAGLCRWRKLDPNPIVVFGLVALNVITGNTSKIKHPKIYSSSHA